MPMDMYLFIANFEFGWVGQVGGLRAPIKGSILGPWMELI